MTVLLTFIGRIPFVQTGLGFNPKTGLGFGLSNEIQLFAIRLGYLDFRVTLLEFALCLLERD